MRKGPSREVVEYLVLAYALSWAWILGLLLTGSTTRPGQGWPTHLPALLGPAVAAVLVTWRHEGSAGVRALGARCVRWPGRAAWWVVAVLAVGAVAWVVASRDVNGLGVYSGAPVLAPALLVVYVLAVNGFGEETGWRGFLADHLLEQHSPRTTSVLVFVAWSLWHLPMFAVVSGLSGLGWATPGWAIGLLAGSIVLTWLYVEGRHSILLVATWHAAFNLTSATRATEGMVAAATSTAVMVAAVVIWWQWRQGSSSPDTSSHASASATRSAR